MNTPTPRTRFECIRVVPVEVACDLENELADAIRERDEARTVLKIIEQAHHSALYREGELKRERDEAREQRDRLAAALERIRDYQGLFAEDDPQSVAAEALQSLTPNAKP